MRFGLTLLQTGHELPAPPWAIGVLAFVVLALMMLITLAIGKGRPHS
jgi:hypothetical protein